MGYETASAAVFSGCSSLSEITFGIRVETIPAYAFDRCQNLTKIEIPFSVSTIGAGAFRDCNLSEVWVAWRNPSIIDVYRGAFSSANKATLYVPSETCEKYKELSPWNNFKEILEYETPESMPEEVVDLGIGVLWAKVNLGAQRPEYAGRLYNWDITLPEKELGDEWRMPTRQEIKDLVNKCTWAATTLNGESVFQVTGPNGNSIYLPATGWISYSNGFTSDRTQLSNGYYWTSTTETMDNTKMAYVLTCSDGKGNYEMTYNINAVKMAIRPVKDMEQPKAEEIDLGLNVMWSSMNLGAKKPEDKGKFYEWDVTLPEKELGDEWRMPTQQEIKDLVNKCTWTLTTINGESVFMVTGPNGNSIYLPKTGWVSYIKEYDYTGDPQLTENGFYWTSTTKTIANTEVAYVLTCCDKESFYDTYYNIDAVKMAIRPVKDKVMAQDESVNLGLPSGTEWASMNLGAERPSDYGNYYAWGETKPKSTYTKENSLWYGVEYNTLLSKGVINEDGNLTSSYDAATVNWGDAWRMPSVDEIKELIDCCTWIWTSQDGHKGYQVTGPNGNSIFLPAAGYCKQNINSTDIDSYFWSSRVDSDINKSYYLYIIYNRYFCDVLSRFTGVSIRPVKNTCDYIPSVMNENENKPVDIYTITGQLIRKNIRMEDACKQLSKGIYICNGKKLIIR